MALPTNLPVQRTGFVGREKEVAVVKELLLRPDVRLVTVTGPGGIGKTRLLAVQVASGLLARFPGGTHFVSLSALSDPDLIASVIVQTLGIREAAGAVAARNTQGAFTRFVALANAAPTRQFRATGSGSSYRG